MKKIIVYLANGFEEVEAITPIDYLRRAGASVVIAGLGSKMITGAHGINVQSDVLADSLSIKAADLPDMVVIPGGMPGSTNLAGAVPVQDMLKAMHKENRFIGAICAAPVVVLASLGILQGKHYTCYPGMEKQFAAYAPSYAEKDSFWQEKPVVVDKNIVTSRGPGTAGLFALQLVECLYGAEAAEKLAQGLVLK